MRRCGLVGIGRALLEEAYHLCDDKEALAALAYVREIYNDSYYNEGIWDIPKRKPDYLSIWYGDHRICIDCGSGFPDRFDPDYEMMGRLGCLRLDDGKEFYSKEIFEK